MKRDWSKYEVKDGGRNYWVIFLYPIDVEGSSKERLNTTLGSEGYFSLEWRYYVLFEPTKVDRFSRMTEKQIEKSVNADGIFTGTFDWEAHIDDIGKPRWEDHIPTAQQILRDYHSKITYALMCACEGNITEKSLTF